MKLERTYRRRVARFATLDAAIRHVHACNALLSPCARKRLGFGATVEHAWRHGRVHYFVNSWELIA